MNRSDARRALWGTTVQGFVTIRGAARDEAPEAGAVGPTGAVGSAHHVAQVAGACLAARRAAAAGEDGLTALVRAWSGADRVGRHWIEETVRMYLRQAGTEEFLAACRGGRRPESAARGMRRRRCSGLLRSRAVRWCDDMLSVGFQEIAGLAAAWEGEPGDATGSEIRRIAELCHRIPCPQEIPTILRAWLVPGQLRREWAATSERGRAWCRSTSAGLGYRVPRRVQRVIRP